MAVLKPMLLGGEWRETDDYKILIAPYSGQQLAHVFYASQQEVNEAISVASSAAKEMLELTRYDVAEGLHRIAHYIKENRELFARTITEESAKPITLARAETDRAVSTFTVAAEEARRFGGESIPIDTQPVGKNRIGWTSRIPRGVIFGITPFNFPLNLVAHKVAPALASKNSIIVKPSPRTPLTSLLLGEAFLASGLPKGALQVVPMDVELLDIVLKDERVAMISFTGSAAVGWNLKARSGQKAIALELGGNAPVIVAESADVDYSIEKSVPSAFGYAGQVCISAQRFFVHSKIYDEWTDKFVERAKNLKNGNPLDDATQISVMIDEAAALRVESWVEEAIGAGAKLLCGGKREGSFYEPTVLTNVHNEMRVCSEEVFAPVASLQPFDDFMEAITEANNSKYGLQAGVFTRDLNQMTLAAQRLEYGGVIINDTPSFRVDNMPYGGMKDSGFGREGVRYAMEEMTEQRLIVITQT